jgi:hypothetical protein
VSSLSSFGDEKIVTIVVSEIVRCMKICNLFVVRR